ncbi:uncharacterized protein LOC100573828 [Acyrthosiphon pisum]|uniref:Uncharacterized protein n=1 Tax=Acyrthosiphon pisum TaxID=7029 RepID=A0A8R1W802_ACYPI|nr:uncharacterized protein LOC100573828 [Acyrthosiphon pisum]|eukprot:XP_003242537.1 PREDICTED: uncharacterized protein LOC100573828 [Acyrthosiphon pisum]
MFPVQVLVVLSTMIILNQSATLKYENQSSVAAGYDADKMTYEILNNMTYISNGNYSETTSPYYFNVTEFLENVDFSEINATDIFESINNSNETALPVLKSNKKNWTDFFQNTAEKVAEKIVEKVVDKIAEKVVEQISKI